MSRSTRSGSRDVTVATVVSSSKMKDSLVGDDQEPVVKAKSQRSAFEGQVEIDEAELLANLGQVRGPDGDQIVFQVIQDANGDQQIVMDNVGQFSEDQTVHFSEQQGQEATEQKTPELSEEEIQQELQALLDSQLPDQEPSDISKHLISSRDQLDDGQGDQDDDDLDTEEGESEPQQPKQEFTSTEIRAFMNTQIRKQHQQQVLANELVDHNTRTSLGGPNQQQHIILVTQTGEKILLVQNPSELEDSAEIDYQPITELNEEEEAQLQATTRNRQQALMSQLEVLRKRHLETLAPEVTTPAVPHLQPIELKPYPSKEDDVCVLEPMAGGENEASDFSSFGSKMDERFSAAASAGTPDPKKWLNRGGRSKRKEFKMPKRGAVSAPKWLRPVIGYMTMALQYVKRREDKIDEVAKFFPSASVAFEMRAKDLKADFLKIELLIERFRNTIGNDLEEVSFKFKSFLKDYHLESFVGEIEAEDEMDEFDENTYEVDSVALPLELEKGPSSKRSKRKTTASGLKIIVPPSVTMTAAASERPRGAAEQAYDQAEDEDVDVRAILEAIDSGVPVDSNDESTFSVTRVTPGGQRPIRSARIQKQLHEKQGSTGSVQKKRPGRPKKPQEKKDADELAARKFVKSTPQSFRCHVVNCGKYFVMAARLKEHSEMVHGAEGDVVYSCPVDECDKTFAQLSVLRKHQQNVHGLGHYKCSACTFKHKSKAALQSHVKKAHADIYDERLFQDSDQSEEVHADVYTFRDAEEEEGAGDGTIGSGDLVTVVQVPGADVQVSDSSSLPSKTRGQKRRSEELGGSNWTKVGRIQRPKAIRTDGVQSVDLVGDVDHDDSDIIKELRQMDVVRNPELFFAPVRKTPSISSASSPHPSLRSGNGGNGNGARKEDEISLECRSDCNFSAIDESSNAETFRSSESPPVSEGVNPGHLDISSAAPGVENTTLASTGTGRPTRAAAARTPKYDTLMQIRTRKSTHVKGPATGGSSTAPVTSAGSKKPKTIHI